jgi:hypothetical protein
LIEWIAASTAAIRALTRKLVASGAISTPVVATYGFQQVTEAITKAGESGGKVLFTGHPR